MDPYLDDVNVINRLVDEWTKYGKIVIAYDFDDTVYDFHKKGFRYDAVVSLLQRCKEQGAYFVVYTANNDYEFIKQYLNKNNIPFDFINEQPEHIPVKGKKLYYNVLLDDRAGLSSAYNCLNKALWTVRVYSEIRREEVDNAKV